ncbi:MAG: CRISPR-associated endonuclease Cas2 [Candidatus Nanopelagicales bacterium]
MAVNASPGSPDINGQSAHLPPSGSRRYTVLVCYDIVDDGIRFDVAQALSEHGPRVQLSTFEIRVSPEELKTLTARLTALVEPECDQVRLYNFGTRAASPTIIGCRTLEEWNDFIIV